MKMRENKLTWANDALAIGSGSKDFQISSGFFPKSSKIILKKQNKTKLRN